MNPEDLDRILFVTRRFQQLQGLRRMVPVGLVLLSMGLGSIFLPSHSSLLLAVLAGAVFLSLRARAYYLERFGKVEPRREPIRVQILTAGVFLAILSGELLAERGLYPEDLVFYAGLAILFILNYFEVVGEARLDQGHHLVLGALFLILAIPSSSVAAWLPGRTLPGVNLILGGTAIILAGLLDHRLLVRTLGRLAEDFQEDPA